MLSGIGIKVTEGEAGAVVMIVLSAGSECRWPFFGLRLANESPGV